MEMNDEGILLMRLTGLELPDLYHFDSGDAETNNYLKTEAYEEQERGLNNNLLLYYHGELAAFCSLCCDSLRLNKDEKTLSIPAIKIARMGKEVRFKDYDFDKILMDAIKAIAYELCVTKVGVRYLTVDATAAQEEYFAKFGFVRNQTESSDGLISMRADVL